MSATILLPRALRDHVDGLTELQTTAPTVAAAIDEIIARFPVMRRHLFDDGGALRGFVRVYLNETDAADDLHTPVQAGDTIMIVPSVAGGSDADMLAARSVFADAEVARYARHIALPEVGWAGQKKLRDARVAIVGAGGLGSPLLLYLAAAGVGTNGIIDDDAVDLSNLQRQVLYSTGDIGTAKVDAAGARAAGINPHVDIVKHALRLTSQNALDVLASYDVVIDGTDNFPTRYLVNDACVLLGKPYVYGSILRFEGQVSVFDGRTGPCYRCLFREPPPPGLVPSCAEGGVLGVLPGIIGSLQALEAIKLILGQGDTLLGRLVLFDALAFRWRELKLRRNPECPACGDHPTVTALIDYDDFCGLGGNMDNSTPEKTDWTPAELKQRLDSGEDIVLIDVREPYEWAIANLEPHGARLLPLGDLPDRLDEIDRERTTVLYCRSGARSGTAMQHMRANGFERVFNLKGGINAWAQDVDPSMTPY